MLIDINFLIENWTIIAALIFVIYLSNHFINAIVLHYFGSTWKNSLYGGALLAQIGELSFVLATSAYYARIINDFVYQLTVVIISLSLLFSPFWIIATKKILGIK